MTKEELLNIINKEDINEKSKELLINQINIYFDALDNYKTKAHNYKIGDELFLKKGTLIHGTHMNIDGLKEIVNKGLLCSQLTNGRNAKYPLCVGVWNLKEDYYLKDYINFYSGGTIRYNNMENDNTETEIISYDDMSNCMEIIKNKGYHRWYMEQTKEARFLPSLIQDKVQIGIIFSSDNEYINKMKKADILDLSIDDDVVMPFVNSYYYEKFLKDRKNKDDFFTDRESAIVFGIPSDFVEGILVGRDYEKNEFILNQIKELLPNCYICNLDGIIIR